MKKRCYFLIGYILITTCSISLEAEVSKALKREVVRLEKKGWRTFSGDPSITKQLQEYYEKLYEYDDNMFPAYIISSAAGEGRTIAEAEQAAMDSAKFDLWSQYEVEISAMSEIDTSGSYASINYTGCMGEKLLENIVKKTSDGDEEMTIISTTSVNMDGARRTCFKLPYVRKVRKIVRLYRVVSNGYEVYVTICNKCLNVKIGDLYYYIDEDTHTAELTYHTSYSALSSIVIPPTVSYKGKSYAVKEVTDNAFYYGQNISEVRYPKGVNLYRSKLPTNAKLILYDPQPPLLAVEGGSLQFIDETQNNCIDAEEKCYIKFNVVNKGKGKAEGCETKVNLTGTSEGIKVQTKSLPAIAVGEVCAVSIPISSNFNTQDGKATFSIEVTEPSGWGVAPFDLTIATKAYEPPLVQVVDYSVSSNSGKICKMEPFTLTFNLQNIKYGDAEQVKVKINLPNNVFVMDGLAEQSFAQIKSGETQTIQIVLAANNNYTDTNIPVTIDVKERFGKFAENKQLNIALNATVSSSVNIAAKDEPQQNRKEIQLALLSSDVDRDIPTTNNQNKNTFAVIIGNEIYDNVDKVPYAQNDARIFRQYCEKTLGIPAKNIREYSNATRGQIQGSLDWLKEISKAFNKPNFIIYYAGHGVPDEITKESYLLPKDGYANNLNTCYKLNDFYETLGAMPADKIIVFLDACFSGAKPSGETLNFGKRGIAIKADPGKPQGNTIVLAATTKDEPAYPYTDKQHGMFTYYLLKKMQSDVDITLGKLFEYIKEQVTQQSVLENNKMQVPQPVSSLNVADTWQSWKLK